MKRYLIATGVGAMVFAGALGSAAALDINDAGVAQYGSSSDLVCDGSGVTIDGYNLETDAVSTSHGIKVSDIANSCNGRTLVATVVDGSGATLAKAAKVIDGNTVTMSWAGGAALPVSELEGVRLTIG